MRRAHVLLLLFGLLWAACDLREFEPPWKLTKLRILGVKVEPPELYPGESFDVEALAWTPRATTPTYRWAACWLGDLLGGGGAGSGSGSGNRSSERPSFEEEPPPTCFDQEGALLLGEGQASQGQLDMATLQGMVALLADGVGGAPAAPDLPDVGQPLDDALEAFRDIWTVLLLGGALMTVSVEVDDGVEKLRANKRLLVRLVPAPGPPPHDPFLSRLMDMQDDEGDAEQGPTLVRYGYDDDHFYLDASLPAADTGLVLRAYLPRQRVDPATGEPVDAPHVSVTREGWPAVAQGLGVATELTVDPAAGTAQVAIATSPEAWPEPAAAADVTVTTDPSGTVAVTAPLETLGLSTGDPLAFFVTAVRGGEVVDAVPNAGRRWVFAGPRNSSPPQPSFRRAADADPDRLEPLDALTAGPGERVRLFPVEEVSAAREPHLSLSFWGKVAQRRETLYASWFTDQGDLPRQKRFGREPDDLAITWTAPGATSGWKGAVFVVLRDGRGGTTWATLPVEPEPNR